MKKGNIDVTGLSIEDIMNLDVSKFTERELKQVTTRLVSAANKRIARFQKAGITSPAYQQVISSGGSFSVAGKTRNQTLSEFRRVKNFLNPNTKTGTVRKAKAFKASLYNTLSGGKKLDTSKFTDKDFSTFWRTMKRLEEKDPAFYKVHYEEIRRDVFNAVSDGDDVDDILTTLENKYEEIAEKEAFDIENIGTEFYNPFE